MVSTSIVAVTATEGAARSFARQLAERNIVACVRRNASHAHRYEVAVDRSFRDAAEAIREALSKETRRKG